MTFMGFNFDDYFNKLNNGEVILSYKGSITAEWINGVLEGVEGKLDSAEVDSRIKKKMYNVLVEGLQNLFHHVDDIPEEMREKFESKFGVLVIRKIENSFKVSLGNFVTSNKTKYLKDKIDKINSLTEEELKDMYKFILNHQKLSAKGGGGLGLVDMARKTGNKLEYSFYEFNSDFSFFNLDVLIN
jgi:succinate dehydrogenase flavin-adding protein (antitoxin of CptAB toxin-antitoxin module)